MERTLVRPQSNANIPRVNLEANTATFERVPAHYNTMWPPNVAGEPAIPAARVNRSLEDMRTGNVRVGGGHLRTLLEWAREKGGRAAIAGILSTSAILGLTACDNAGSQEGDNKKSVQLDVALANGSEPTSDLFRYTDGDPTKADDDKATRAFGGKVSPFDFANPQGIDSNKNTIENARLVLEDIVLNMEGNSSIAAPHLMSMAHAIHVDGLNIPDMQQYLSPDGKQVVDPQGLNTAMQAFADKIFHDTKLDDKNVPVDKLAHGKVTEAIKQFKQKYEANLGSVQFSKNGNAYSTLELLQNNAVNYLHKAFPNGEIDLTTATIDGRTVKFSLACGGQFVWDLPPEPEPIYVEETQEAPMSTLVGPRWQPQEAPQEAPEEHVEEAPAPAPEPAPAPAPAAPAPLTFQLPNFQITIPELPRITLPEFNFQAPITPPPADKDPGLSSRVPSMPNFNGNGGERFGADPSDYSNSNPGPTAPSRPNPVAPLLNGFSGFGGDNSGGGNGFGGFNTGTTPETRSGDLLGSGGVGDADTDTSTSTGTVGE